MTDWITCAIALQRERRVDTALDVVYDNVDRIMYEEETYAELDEIFRTLEPEYDIIDLCIGMLAGSSYQMKGFPSRPAFLEKTLTCLRDNEEEIGYGLEAMLGI